ncbi:MAG: F0F1 ATP synthase subunit delta [Deltaproteobacteria bacterium]|nr:F0F1 ATP synthase subunit delta [Deltaproteobacteria bacterium]
MSINAIPRRYARALVGLAEEQNKVEEFAAELEKVQEAFAANKELKTVLINPTYSAGKKTALLNDVTEYLGLSEDIRKFLGLLLEKDRLKYYLQILESYRQLADESSGIERAQLTSAKRLTKEQKEQIKAELEKQTGKKVDLEVKVDSSLLGGIKTEIGGRVVDGSLETQLKRMGDTLTKG